MNNCIPSCRPHGYPKIRTEVTRKRITGGSPITRILEPTKIQTCYRNSISKCSKVLLQRNLKNRVREKFALWENRVIGEPPVPEKTKQKIDFPSFNDFFHKTIFWDSGLDTNDKRLTLIRDSTCIVVSVTYLVHAFLILQYTQQRSTPSGLFFRCEKVLSVGLECRS